MDKLTRAREIRNKCLTELISLLKNKLSIREQEIYRLRGDQSQVNIYIYWSKLSIK